MAWTLKRDLIHKVLDNTFARDGHLDILYSGLHPDQRPTLINRYHGASPAIDTLTCRCNCDLTSIK